MDWLVVNGALAAALLAFAGGLIWSWRGKKPRERQRPRRALRIVLTFSGAAIVAVVAFYVWVVIQLRNFTF
ncbi:hypothetical protein MHY85_04300 [Cellulomonas sp. ACRRI]|uniref:hypothetical protein n=1 Tax=Cellulomonas sp. ACRRI TaxID=2918188 RepID=UPI001EF2CF22|nr:hypothetical protein [Cellulomonas sp. ACRRI]MCG7285196.1 hypothetical protein [Cellulomonas sp. ACRRI]